MDKSQLVLMLIALGAPLIVWGVKALVPRIPKLMLPAIATALGPLLDYLATLAGAPSSGIVVSLLAGGAAVGVRELVDQAKKAVKA